MRPLPSPQLPAQLVWNMQRECSEVPPREELEEHWRASDPFSLSAQLAAYQEEDSFYGYDSDSKEAADDDQQLQWLDTSTVLLDAKPEPTNTASDTEQTKLQNKAVDTTGYAGNHSAYAGTSEAGVRVGQH